jgi:hypothetical protein
VVTIPDGTVTDGSLRISTTAVVGSATTFTEDLVVSGDARVTGILTVGTSSITLDGSNNQINVGTGVTVGSSGINVSGIITSTSIVVSAGTTSAPSISPSGDSNTGIFFPSADTIAASTGGTSRITIDSSGNIKITTNQFQALSHKNFGYSGSYGALVVGAGGDNYGNISLGVDVSSISGGSFHGQNQVIFPATGGIIPDNAGTNFVGFYNRSGSDSLVLGPAVVGGITSGPLTLTSTSVGIGTGSPTEALTVNGRVQSQWNAFANGGTTSYSGDATSLVTGSTAGMWAARSDSALLFAIGSNEKARIDSSGRLGIGITSPGSFDTQADNLVVGTGSGHNGATIYAGTGSWSSIYFADGTSSTEKFRGIQAYDHSADAMLWYTSAIERARIDSSGRLLIGTSTSPSAGNGQYGRLVVQGYIGDSTAGAYINLQRGQPATTPLTADVEIARINFSDSVGYDFAYIGCYADATSGTGDYPGRLTFSTTADGASSPTERMRIGNGGDFYFRTTNSDPAFNRVNGIYINQNSQLLCRVNGGSGWDLGASTSTPIHISFYTDNGSARVAAGNISSNGSTTTYSATSDYRLKENINLLTAATKRVLDLRPVTFDWKEGLGGTQPQGEGFIAHEVQAVCPLAVTGEKDAVDEKGNPKYQGVDPAKLVALLTAALQEAIGEIESLKARVAALESA